MRMLNRIESLLTEITYGTRVMVFAVNWVYVTSAENTPIPSATIQNRGLIISFAPCFCVHIQHTKKRPEETLTRPPAKLASDLSVKILSIFPVRLNKAATMNIFLIPLLV